MIKLDLISGFLGAGKTTFVNKLLRHYVKQGKRPVYVVNEFGKTGLDAEIIKVNGFEAIEIEGGCICCTLKDDISATILQVAEAFNPTNIIVEPSGIFIFDNFFEMLKEPEIRAKCELGNIFTIVDSVNFTFAKAVYGGFIYNQIKNAPTIILSKLEKAKAQNAEELICDIKNINDNAKIFSKIWESWTEGDMAELLDSGATAETWVPSNAHSHVKLKSVTVKSGRVFTAELLDNFVVRYHAGEFGEIYRIKGIVKSETGLALLNITNTDVTITPYKGVAEPSLTFIGQSVAEGFVV